MNKALFLLALVLPNHSAAAITTCQDVHDWAGTLITQHNHTAGAYDNFLQPDVAVTGVISPGDLAIEFAKAARLFEEKCGNATLAKAMRNRANDVRPK
jgi:hypothetical protein